MFTPALLEMTQRPYMDSLAAAAFPAIGGAFYGAAGVFLTAQIASGDPTHRSRSSESVALA